METMTLLAIKVDYVMEPIRDSHNGLEFTALLTAAIFPTQVRESPHVSEPDGVSYARQQEVELSCPGFPVRNILLLLLLVVVLFLLYLVQFGPVVGRDLVQLHRHLSIHRDGFSAVCCHFSGFG